MKPHEGIRRFLELPLREGRLDNVGLAQAILTAYESSPQAAYKFAVAWWRVKFGGSETDAQSYGKGVRWLAILRRDEGKAAFEAACEQLAELVPARPPTAIDLTGRLAVLAGADVAAVNKALELAIFAHARQKRPGGEPQIVHLLRVAIRAAEYARAHRPADFLTLVQAALLHDALEDTAVPDRELSRRFGPEVAAIVRAVSHEEEEEPDSAYLARVAAGGELAVLVKRFDRLDNLSCLRQMPADFRARKAGEVRAALPIWQEIDPEGAREIERLLGDLP